MKRTLVLHDGTQPVPQNDGDVTAVRLWEAYPPSLGKTIWHSVRIVVSDATKLQGLVAFTREIGRTTRLSIEVGEIVGISLLRGPVGPVDGRQVLSLSREEADGLTTLRFRLAYHAAVWTAVASSVANPLSTHSGLGPQVRLGIGLGVSPNWLGLAADTYFLSDTGRAVDAENPGPLPRVDVAIMDSTPTRAGELDTESRSTIAHDFSEASAINPRWPELARVAPIAGAPVETRLFNPVGVVRVPSAGWAYLRPAAGGGILICDESGSSLRRIREITPATISALRPYRGVVDSGAAFLGPASRRDALLRLTASGVPVVSPDARSTLNGWLPNAVIQGFAVAQPALDDSEAREGVIIRQVRNAHRYATWRDGSYEPQRGGTYDDLSVSVGIATMRPEYLEHVLSTFEGQTWQRKQLLIGLHGFGLEEVSPALRRRVEAAAVIVEWPENGLFGDLLRELTIRADGDLFAKMDDDDWYSPYHLEDLVYALQYSGASLVGSGVQFVYMHSADITIRRSIDQSYRFGGHPGGPTFMAPRGTILRAGNWPRVRRAVDTGLNDAILAMGGTVYQSHAHNFLFNRRSSGRGHTWKATNAYFIEKAKISWSGIRPPLGFEGMTLPNLEWRSTASSVVALERSSALKRVDRRPPGRLSALGR